MATNNLKDSLRLIAYVVEELPSSEFIVEIEIPQQNKTIKRIAYAIGKLSTNRIKILKGDKVEVTLDKYAIAGNGKAKIVYRHNPGR